MRRSFFPTNGTISLIVFLKYRDKLSTKQKKFRQTRDAVWHEIFAGSNFYDFSSDPQKQSPPPTKKKLTKTFLPEKMYSRVLNILSIKFTTQKYSTKKPCKCNYNSPLQFRNKTGNNGLVLHNARTPQYCLKICISITL